MLQIIYISDSNKHFEQAIKEYEKRLSKDIKFIRIKPSKNRDSKIVIKNDTENINKILQKQKDSFNIMLSLDWKQFDTIWFSKLIEEKKDKWTNINFIIWWAFGLNEKELVNLDYKLNLSKLTFPHWLALLVLLEQIYRSFQIIQGRNYHY